VGDPLDHPSTDGQYPALLGGANVCTDVALIEQEALNFPSTLPYNPWPGGTKYPGPGVNSNSFASFLLKSIGLNLGTPPSAPGWGIWNP
jgi:hypothetical protein